MNWKQRPMTREFVGFCRTVAQKIRIRRGVKAARAFVADYTQERLLPCLSARRRVRNWRK